ncbi:MAG: hypothetical protein Ta2A_24020 [Treponemataceae bacterium]|nr:MAG: hypothetical protein Ta2A_24020 [Treponemataceae bacterium]
MPRNFSDGFFGIGNAIVDYYFEFADYADFPRECAAGKAHHVDSGEFKRIIDNADSANSAIDGIDNPSDANKKGCVSMFREAGGSVFNSLKIISQLAAESGSKPESLVFVGAIGADNEGLFFSDRAKHFGISFLTLPQKSEPHSGAQTGQCAFFKAKTGETAILASPGAASHISARNVATGDVAEVIARSRCILFEAAHLANHELTEKIVSSCIASRKPIAFLCGTVYGAGQLSEYMHSPTSIVNRESANTPPVFIFANAAEGQLLQNIPKVNCIYVETHGESGGFAEDFLCGSKTAGQRFDYEANKPQITAVGSADTTDETGCGDAFAAAFLLEYFSMQSVPSASGFSGANIPFALKKAAEVAGRVSLQKLCNLH